MADAVSGAIYVIGGRDSTTIFDTVWASTDGGARAGLAPAGMVGFLKGNTQGGIWGVLRVLRGTTGYYRVLQEVLRGTTGNSRGTTGGVLEAYPAGT